MNYDAIRRIAETFMLESFANVLSVRIIHISTEAFEQRPTYKVDCLVDVAGRGSGASQIRAEVTIEKDGRVTGLHHRPLQGNQRGRTVLRPRRRVSRYTQ